MGERQFAPWRRLSIQVTRQSICCGAPVMFAIRFDQARCRRSRSAVAIPQRVTPTRFVLIGLFVQGFAFASRRGANAHWALTRARRPPAAMREADPTQVPPVYAALNEHPSWSLAAIGSLSTEDLVALAVKDAQSDRSRRPSDICRSDDCCR
jgi:hypothetical protein